MFAPVLTDWLAVTGERTKQWTARSLANEKVRYKRLCCKTARLLTSTLLEAKAEDCLFVHRDRDSIPSHNSVAANHARA
jgi:hypothetical protein